MAIEKNCICIQRNRNIDIFRAISILMVVIYHIWVLTGYTNIKIKVFRIPIQYGGEIGVTAFFMLSGYGIYNSLYKNDGQIKYSEFLKKRIKRILPDYYVNLILTLLLTSSAVYIQKSGIINVVTHFLLLHNFSINYSGAINGVLWTMPIIFQFYLIAYILYKGFKRYAPLIIIGSIVITILSKYIIYNTIMDNPQLAVAFPQYAFFSGRQLLTSLDNFVLGMGVAWLSNRANNKINRWNCAVLFIAGVILLYADIFVGERKGIYTNNISGYIWHSSLAVALAIMMISISLYKKRKYGFISKLFIQISEIEYNIYLWHLVIIQNIINVSPMVQGRINAGYFWQLLLMFLVISILFGYMMTQMTRNIMEKIKLR